MGLTSQGPSVACVRGILRSCVFLLLLAAATGCEPAREPRPEPAPMPLVIGTSPHGQVTAPPSPLPPADEPVVASKLAVPARDPRLALSSRRGAGALAAEVHNLEALHATAQPLSGTRLTLARGLADTYAELARATEGTTAGREAHASAAKYYQVVATEYPKSSASDEAQYYAGLEHELEGNRTAARREYFTLIKNHPASKLVPFAYFAFGEMFREDAETDPSKYALAEQAFREVRRFPPPDNPLYDEAHRRLGEIVERMRAGAGGATRP